MHERERERGEEHVKTEGKKKTSECDHEMNVVDQNVHVKCNNAMQRLVHESVPLRDSFLTEADSLNDDWVHHTDYLCEEDRVHAGLGSDELERDWSVVGKARVGLYWVPKSRISLVPTRLASP